MRLAINFSLLLLTLLMGCAVEAAPMSKRKPGVITLPLRSLHARDRDDLHPRVYMQQQINRAERRLARMTGRAPPSDAVLLERLVKRIVVLDHESNANGALIKRYTSPTFLDAFKSNAAKLNTTAGGRILLGNNTDSAGGVPDFVIQAAIEGTVTAANEPATANSLGLNIEGADTGYVAVVQLGTPPKDFQILMDSGSADFWVGSENCKSEVKGDCGAHRFLGTQSSSSFIDTKVPFNVTYGTGNVAGTVVNDTLVLAGLQLPNHQFGVANLESPDFTGAPFDGLMGLAQSGISQQGVATPVEALQISGLINEAIVSYKISRLADKKNDGEITFGALDTTKFDSATLVTLPNINAVGFWEANMDAVSVDGADVGLQGRSAILDTGTTLIVAPPQDVAAVHALIKGAKPDGQGGFTVPCTTNQTVALTFSGTSFSINPRDLAPLPIDPANPAGDCTSGIAPGQVGSNTEWLVGDVFLKNAYFSTNENTNTVSLAKLV